MLRNPSLRFGIYYLKSSNVKSYPIMILGYPSAPQSMLYGASIQYTQHQVCTTNIIQSTKSTRFLVPEPWYISRIASLPLAGRKEITYDRPSNSQLAFQLGRYTSLTWRGRDPDQRPPSTRPVPLDRVWEDDVRCEIIAGFSRTTQYIEEIETLGVQLHNACAKLYALAYNVLKSPHLSCWYLSFLQLAPKFPSTFTLLDVLHVGDHYNSSRVQLLLSTGLSEILLVEEQQLSLRMSISKVINI